MLGITCSKLGEEGRDRNIGIIALYELPTYINIIRHYELYIGKVVLYEILYILNVHVHFIFMCYISQANQA